jgi:UDP-N-acetylmuramyl pentapeptide phosphotransferase/UDP-N-acetylglucosamine-1-phosphate transferase
MIILQAIVACAVVLATEPIVVGVTRRFGVVDVPSHRSSHTTPVPRGGGVAVAVGAVLGLILSPGLSTSAHWALVIGAGSFGAIGLVEDVVGIPALARLVLQAGAAIVLLRWALDELSGPAAWEVLFGAGVVVWIVAYVNAFNFMDGIDGMSVGQVVIAALAWYLIGRSEAVPVLAVGAAVAGAAALGFLPFNMPNAKVFLGDVGSYFLGAWLAILTVIALRAGIPVEAALAPLALYLADTGTTLVRRLRTGETWYLPHRDHVYQRLVQRGWSHVRVSAVVAICIGVCSALGAASLMQVTWLRATCDSLLVGVLVGYVTAPSWLGQPLRPVPVSR